MEPSKSEPIRVLIVDGNPQICRALARLLHPADNIKIIATSTDEIAAIALAVRFAPAVVLLDVGNTRMDGMAITRALCQQAPTTRVVMLSIYAIFGSQAIAAGACRFLLKDCGRDELVAAIRLAANGQCQTNWTS